jgi:hypothetical protein
MRPRLRASAPVVLLSSLLLAGGVRIAASQDQQDKTVTVTGQVANPGQFRFTVGMTVHDAIAEAGGLADSKAVLSVSRRSGTKMVTRYGVRDTLALEPNDHLDVTVPKPNPCAPGGCGATSTPGTSPKRGLTLRWADERRPYIQSGNLPASGYTLGDYLDEFNRDPFHDHAAIVPLTLDRVDVHRDVDGRPTVLKSAADLTLQDGDVIVIR